MKQKMAGTDYKLHVVTKKCHSLINELNSELKSSHCLVHV